MSKDTQISSGSTRSFQVHALQADQRIDAFISAQFPNYSRSFLQKLFKAQKVTANNKVVKASYNVRKNDVISISFPETGNKKPKVEVPHDLDVTVVAKEKDFFIINKPAGLTVHPPSTTYTTATLSDWLTTHYEEIAHVGTIDRPGIVHRLDRNTSGLMIIPRTNKAHEAFSDMFKNREVKKTYLAIVMGHPEETGTIDYHIGRHPVLRNVMTHFNRMPEHHTARDAHTKYKVLEYYDDFSLVEVKPTTGRTHQIRVHFKAIGHPLLGDPTYGTESKLIPYHALHASELEFTYEGKHYQFKSPLSPGMKKITKKYKPIV